MENYIDIYDEKGNKKKMEVISIFKLNEEDLNYIIYSELDKSHYYVAKYKGEEIVNLDTNLTNDELKLCNKVLEEIKDVRN